MVLPVRGRDVGCGDTRAVGQECRSAVGTQDLRRLGNVLADALELLAERHDRNQVRRLEHTDVERLAAERFSKRRPCGKCSRAKTIRWTGHSRVRKRRYAADSLQSRSYRCAGAHDNSGYTWHGKTIV